MCLDNIINPYILGVKLDWVFFVDNILHVLYRLKREEEARIAMEETRRLAEEMARKQAEYERRLQFNRSLQLESTGLEHTQEVTRAFVFSYYELLKWLGLDVPEFEKWKANLKF